MDLETFDSQLGLVGNFYDKWRNLANGVIGLKRLKQTHLSRTTGISYTNLNQFLTGRLNLLPAQVQLLFETIGIKDPGLLGNPMEFLQQAPIYGYGDNETNSLQDR